MTFDITIDGNPHRVELNRAEATGRWLCRLDGREVAVDVVQTSRDALSLLLAGRSIEVHREAVASDSGELKLAVGGRRFTAEVRDPRALRSRRAAAHGEGP